MVSFVTSFLALAATFHMGVDAMSLRHAPTTTDRKLSVSDDYGFVVSHIREDKDWCLTAAYGTADFTKLGFRKCDFDGAPANQLFKLDADGKIHSYLDDSKCLILNHGGALFDGVKARLADCTHPTDLNKFSLESNGYLQLELPFVMTPEYCITNRGPNPHNGDTIHAKPCKDRGDFKWTFYNPALVIENEPCGDDTNGGCNSIPPIYTPLHPSPTTTDIEIQGGFYAESGTRDTDWYSFTITEPTLVTASLDSSTLSDLYLADGLCGAPVIAAGTDNSGTPTSFLFTTAGDYAVFIAISSFYGVPCENNATYTASLNFAPVSNAIGLPAQASVQHADNDSTLLLSAHAP